MAEQTGLGIFGAQEKLLALGYSLPAHGADGKASPGGETYRALESFVREHVPMDLGPDERLSPGQEFDLALAALAAFPVPVKVPKPDPFRDLARHSKKLAGIDRRLEALVLELAESSSVPFALTDGVRTVSEQAALVARGASKTMNSRHLTGHAVDLVPLDERGKPSWHWPSVYVLAAEVARTAQRIGVAGDMTWGGAWDRRVSSLEPSRMEHEVSAYVMRSKAQSPKKAVFIDGPHWQIHWTS